MMEGLVMGIFLPSQCTYYGIDVAEEHHHGDGSRIKGWASLIGRMAGFALIYLNFGAQKPGTI